MGCTPELIEAQPKGSFAAYVRGVTKSALPLKFPFGHMEAMSKMADAEFGQFRDVMRKKYAVHISVLDGSAPEKEKHEANPSVQESPKSDTQKPDRTKPDMPDDRADPDW